jgi:hypothetical protein
MSRLRPSTSVAVAVLLVGAPGVVGCTGEQELDGFGSVVDAYADYGPTLDAAGRHPLRRRYLISSGTEVGDGGDTTEERLATAVSMLLGSGEPRGSGSKNFWAGPCAPGLRVDEVELEASRVTVHMIGEVRRPEDCTLTAKERVVRQQQLAWTVTEYLDPFAEKELPIVDLVEANGDEWDVVADPAYLTPYDPQRRGRETQRTRPKAIRTGPRRAGSTT